MALAGELAKYIGNEVVKVGGKELAKNAASSALNSLGTNIASNMAGKVGSDLLSKATSLGLSKNAAGKWMMDTTGWDTKGTGDLKTFMKPILGDNTPSYSRFLEQIGEGEYRGSLNGHTPGWYDDDGAIIKSTLDNIEGSGDILPKIYGNNRESTLNGLLSLGNRGDEARKSASIIANFRGKPDALATIFRQSPKDINYGDWVGLTDSYANLHEGNSELNKLWSKQVPAQDVYFAGDDITEWYYMPREVQLDDEIGNELSMAIERAGASPDVAGRAQQYIKAYHGSPNTGIKQFDINMAGKNTQSGERAIYFTDDYPTAEEFSYERLPSGSMFANKKGAKGSVYTSQLKMKNPLDLDNLTDEQIEALYQFADPRSASLMGKDRFIKTLSEARDAGNSQMIKAQLDLNKLSNSGYDGFIAKMFPGENDVREYGVLDPSVIEKVGKYIPVHQDNYLPLYHQTSAESLADFSLDKRNAGVSDATMPEGIFLKDTDADIGLAGKNQLQLDARLNNPLKVMDRNDLKAKLMAMNPKVAKYLMSERELDNYYEKLSEEAQAVVDKAYEKMYYDKSEANKKAFMEATEKMKDIIPEWRAKIRENAAISQKEIKKLLKDNGYDGMIMDEDRGSFGRKVKSYLVLDKEQLRDNSVPVKFGKNSKANLSPAKKLGNDINSVAEAMKEYKANNRANMLKNELEYYNDNIFDYSKIKSAGEKALKKELGEEGLEDVIALVKPVVNSAGSEAEYELNKKVFKNFIKSKEADKLVELSKKLLPPGKRIYRKGTLSGVSWSTDPSVVDKYEGQLLDYVLRDNDRYVAPQIVSILQNTLDDESQVLFSYR